MSSLCVSVLWQCALSVRPLPFYAWKYWTHAPYSLVSVLIFSQIFKPLKESRRQKIYAWLFKSTSGVSGLSGNSSSSGRLIAMRFRIETGSSTASWKWVTGTNKETSVRNRAELPFPLLYLTVWVIPCAQLVTGQFNFTQKWPDKAHLIGWFQVISGLTNCGLIILLTHLIQGVVGVLDCTWPTGSLRWVFLKSSG